MRSYRTVQGDTWDLIAYRLYPDSGGEKNMTRLLRANSQLAGYAIFPAGLTLFIPDEVITNPAVIPPWRR